MNRFLDLRALVACGVVALLALSVIFPWSTVSIIVGLCFGIAGLGVAIMARAGQISFGHAMYASIGAYTVAFVAKAFPHTDAVLLGCYGVGASVVAGGVIGIFVVRYRSVFFGMLNLAVSMVLYSVLLKAYNVTGGSDGLRIDRPTVLGMTFERAGFESLLLIGTLGLAVGIGFLTQRYFRSAYGEALAGVKTNETRLEYLGLSTGWVMWVGYVTSAGIVGLSGALFVLVQGLVTPDIGAWLRSGEFVFIAVLGGSTHAVGAFLGAAVFELVKLLAAAYAPGMWELLLGGTLILVVVLAPTGLTGLLMQRLPNEPEKEDA